MKNKNFAMFILSNKRANKVVTHKSLRAHGYTGKIYIIVDDEDPTIDDYKYLYGDQVIVFEKKKFQGTFDVGDNFDGRRGVIYARNASFKIAKDLGLKYFMVLDDDYTSFNFRFNKELDYKYSKMLNMDSILSEMIQFMDSNKKILSVAMAQGGDFIGGDQGTYAKAIKATRKCMNSFLCSTERPFNFIGRVNEDVNTYVSLAVSGGIFFTLNQISLQQKQTQANSGGMTELYLDNGTYVKSFYSILYHPSGVKISLMGKNKRLHHSINWKATTPKILRENQRKRSKSCSKKESLGK